MSGLRDFWRRLDGPVHPDDRPFFDGASHTFNLEYPPPAFVGRIDEAPIVVLMANGGYNETTKSEFKSQRDIDEYIDYLTGARGVPPDNLSAYYTGSPLWNWIRGGQLAIANAVAYRSPKLSEEPANRRLAKRLPSYRAHVEWLRRELLPSAAQRKRLVVAHRFTQWGLRRSQMAPNVYFSTNSVSERLSNEMMAQIGRWLDQHGS